MYKYNIYIEREKTTFIIKKNTKRTACFTYSDKIYLSGLMFFVFIQLTKFKNE